MQKNELMGLNLDMTKVKDFDKLKSDEESAKTNVLIWATMTIDLGEITEKNIDEWLFRAKLYTKATGHGLGSNKDGIWNPSKEDLIKRIGLHCNVCSTTRAAYMKKVMKALEHDVEYEIRKER